jgi:galactose mutarotase-like enzyme
MTPRTMQAIILESSFIRLAMRPDLGGRMTSLVDLRSGREWLWKNPYLSQRPPVYGESYTQKLDGGGWDEILPSVSPCRLSDGSAIPDHGDIVSLPATVLSARLDRLILATELRSLPLRFTRELRLHDSQLKIHYTLESLADCAAPYLWAAHPLFALEPGMEITGTQGVHFHTSAEIGKPAEFSGLIPDFHSQDFQPFAFKRFSPSASVDRVGLRHPDGSSIELSWDRGEISHLGLWLNMGAWSGCGSAPYINLGIEPTTSPHDSLADAIQDGSAIILQAGERNQWSLTFELHAFDSSL